VNRILINPSVSRGGTPVAQAPSPVFTDGRDSTMRRKIQALALLGCSLITSLSYSQTQTINEQNWFNVIAQAQPGDTLVIEDSASAYSRKVIQNLHGTRQAPITLKAQTPLGVTLDGAGANSTLVIKQSSHLIIQGLVIKNHSDIDGRTDYTDVARNRLSGSDWHGLQEGLVVYDSYAITATGNLFDDIGTRGALVYNTDRFTATHNLFIDVGNDTASSGLELGGGSTHWRVSGNLFATNVDAITKSGPGTGGIIENNMTVFNRFEDGIDIKAHLSYKGESPYSVVRNNIIYAGKSDYTGMSIQDSSQHLLVSGNVIYDTGIDSALRFRGRCDYREQADTFCRCAVTRHNVHNNWLINRSARQSPGIQLAETSTSLTDPTRASLSHINLSDNLVVGYSTSVNSWNTSQPTTVNLNGNLLFTTSTQADTSNTQWLPDNSLANLPPADALTLSLREQELVDSLVHDYSFTDQMLRKALNKGDIGYPFTRQCQASDNHLAVTAADAGLASRLSNGLMFYSGDSDALGLDALYGMALKGSHDVTRAGKVAFRTLFTNPGEYQLYARLKCINDCGLGDSLYIPTGFDTALDNPDHYQISEPGVTADYQWFNLGSYTPETGLYNSFVLGLRDSYLMIDSLVFHKTTGLENSPATLDQLALQQIARKTDPTLCE